MLTVEQLESRDTPSVTILHGQIMPGDGFPGETIKVIYGEPQHRPGVKIVDPAGGPWARIIIEA